MNYNYFFQQAIANGNTEIEAAEIARAKMVKVQRERLKNRNINSAHAIGTF